ncbi:YybH family protein [Sphingomonas sp. MMS24-J13]|uniref:YybH family protein n=1 Tax=Sphingomonas sp. MMS24-J13 TaxID=3238686 RepID=UPI00384BB543
MTESDEAQIRALRGRHNLALAMRDLDGAMAIVAADAVLVAGNGGILRSKAEIRKAWRSEFARSDYVRYVRTPETIEIGALPDEGRAAETGHWEGLVRGIGGDARLFGRYLVHWIKTPKGWRTIADVYVTLGGS